MYKRRNFLKTSFIGFSGLFFSGLNFSQAKFYSKDEFTINDLMGKSDVALHGKHFKLRKEASDALIEMLGASQKDGFNPYIASSYRSFDHQKRIWNNKYQKFRKEGLGHQKVIEKIIRYSTIPGTSRHHWGTDFDIIGSAKNVPSNPLSAKHFEKDGQYFEFKQWLNENANDFGFYEVYTKNPDRKGFEYEPWHFSYSPLSCKMLKEYVQKEVIGEFYKIDITGSEHFTQEFLTRYLQENILDINPYLIP